MWQDLEMEWPTDQVEGMCQIKLYLGAMGPKLVE